MIYLAQNMDLSGLFILIALIMLGPPILLTVIGFAIKKRNNKAAKILFILSGIYLIVACGLCGSLMS